MQAFSYFLLVLLATGSAVATAQTGRATLSLVDPTRGNREIPLELYYPADQSGTDVPVADGAYPVIAFGHGFAMQPTDYGTLGDALSSAGYVVAFVGTETGFAPSHNDFGLDLLFTVATLPTLAAEPGNLLSGHVLPRRAIAGHSMGGGATWLAAAAAAPLSAFALDCIVGLAPAETNPSAIAAAAYVAVPSLILSGDADAVTPPSEHHLPIHDATAAECRTFVSLLEGGHCGYADAGSLCDLGELFFSGLDRETHLALTTALLTAWFDFHLKDDPTAWTALEEFDSGTPHTLTTIDCASAVVSPFAATVAPPFPNPFSRTLTPAPCGSGAPSEVVLLDLAARAVTSSVVVTPGSALHVPDLPSGIYFLEQRCGSEVERFPVVKE